MYGGELDAGPRPGGGWRLVARIPVEPVALTDGDVPPGPVALDGRDVPVPPEFLAAST